MIHKQILKEKFFLEQHIAELQQKLEELNKWLLENPAPDQPSHEDFVRHWQNGGLEK